MTKIKLDQKELIDPNQAETKKLMQSIQGNILKGHGRNFSRHIFLKINDKNEAKSYLANFAINHVTSALAQFQQAREFQSNGTEHIFCNMRFSSSGYKVLDIEAKKHPKDSIWRNGMKDQGFQGVDIAKVFKLDAPIPIKNPLQDPPVDTCQATFQQDIHVLIL